MLCRNGETTEKWLCSCTAASTLIMLSANEMWARRPCSVLMSEARAQLRAEAAAIFRLLLDQSGAAGLSALRVASSLEELDATRGGDEAGRLRMRAGAGRCWRAVWLRLRELASIGIHTSAAGSLPGVGPTLAAVGGVSFSAAGTGTCQSTAPRRSYLPNVAVKTLKT